MTFKRPAAVLPALGLSLLAVVYLATVLPDLGNDPIIGGDEGWIMSASARLARDGIFGSELFTGFHGADRNYFFNLPLHHILLAGIFKVIGTGVFEARLLSVGFGLLTLGLTYALGRRIGGEVVGIGAAALLVLLRLNLAPFSGLTLTDLGATVRYDLIAVPFALGATLLIAARPHDPSLPRVAVAGLLVELGGLTQFIGAFFLFPLALFLLTITSLSPRRRLTLTAAFGLAATLPLLIYAVFALVHWDDFRGQSRAVDQETNFLSPAFYIDQIRHEPDRYAIGAGLESLPTSPGELASRPSARLVLLVVAPLAVAYSVVRARAGSPLHRLLALLLLGLALEFTLFESTKRYVYIVALVPLLCIAIADLGLALWRSPSRYALPALAVRGVVVLSLCLFAVEGAAVAARDVRDASSAPDYAALTTELEATIPAGATVIADNRLWAALRHRQPRSLLLLFYFTNQKMMRDEVTNIPGAFERIDADYLLLSPLSREDLTELSPADAADFERHLVERAELVTTVDFPDYGPIEVYRLR